MSVKIRLKRMGMKKKPFYRVSLPTSTLPVMAVSSKKSATTIPWCTPLR